MRRMDDVAEKSVAVVGAGPAGLFASECLLGMGFAVSLYDRMPSAGCKFLVAGNRGGLNITNAAPTEEFLSRYGESSGRFASYLSDFSPADLERWLSSLGVSTQRGSGGKIFPDGISVSELLSRWMARLESRPEFSFHAGWNFAGFASAECADSRTRHGPTLRFETGGLSVERRHAAVIFALGGASWPETGSDGKWTDPFRESGIALAPFLPANCGFEADWPELLKSRFANVPLKNIVISVCGKSARGELMLTPYGIEGGVTYWMGSAIRASIARDGMCEIFIDLLPDWLPEKIAVRLAGGPGKESLSNWLRKRLGLDSAAVALLREAAISAEISLRDAVAIAALVKAVPVTLYRPRPIAEAISSAGGVKFSGLDDNLMLKEMPDVFCAGEMIDWEAPTGGFLMQGCFSTAFRAAKGAAGWLARCE